MKITGLLSLALLSSTSAFMVAPVTQLSSTSLEASRSDVLKVSIGVNLPSSARSHASHPHTFLATRQIVWQTMAAGLAFVIPSASNAMDQANIQAKTETWETGSPMNSFRDGDNLYKDARTQLNSNFAPIKRLTLERKSPVTRLDLNSPGFSGYKKTYPGLFEKDGKKAPVQAAAPPPAEAPPVEGEAAPAAASS